MLRSSVRTAVLSFSLCVVQACSHFNAPAPPCFARIEAIDEKPGEYYSPTKGRKPLYEIRLQLSDNARRFRVLLLDLYSPDKYGDVGDIVALTLARDIRADQVIWFEEIIEYRVAAKIDPRSRKNQRIQ